MFEFEKPIANIKTKIEELKQISAESGMDLSSEIEKFEQQAEEYQHEIYENLKPSEKLQNIPVYVHSVKNIEIDSHQMLIYFIKGKLVQKEILRII